ncbi:hypothetical protein FQZ97_763420 [compost metagenome]
MALAQGEPASKPDVDDLVRIGDGGRQPAGKSPLLSDVARFFAQLALCASQAVLTLIELARRELDHHGPHGVAELPLKYHLAIVQQANDHDGPGVQDVLPRGFMAGRQAHGVAHHVQKMTFEQLSA